MLMLISGLLYGDPLPISRILSLVLCSVNSSCLVLLFLSFIFPAQEVGLGPCFLLPSLETSVIAVAGAVLAMTGLPLFVSHLLGSTVLHTVMPHVCRTIISCILSLLWWFQLEGQVLFLVVHLVHKWKSLELHLSRQLCSVCFAFKGVSYVSMLIL